MPRRPRSSSGSLGAVHPSTLPAPPRTLLPPASSSGSGEDASPSSEIRPLPPNAPTRFLLISAWLRGPEAEAAWVTVTDVTGRAHFEGPLLPDGRLTVTIDAPASIDRVCVRLETVRWHRQAEVAVREPSNAYAFT